SGSDTTSGISRYEIRLNEGDWINKSTGTSHTFTGLLEGVHMVYVRAHNNAGHNTTVSVNFTVDISSPTVEITSPEDGELFAIDTVVITWNGSDPVSDISLYQICLNGGDWIDVGTETSHILNDLPDGTHTVEVRAHDNAGNNATTAASFTVDTVPPEIYHEPMSRWHKNDEVVIEAEVTDNFAVENVTFYYSYNGITGNISMDHIENDLYRAVLPAINAECVLEYTIHAVDWTDNSFVTDTYSLHVLRLTPPTIEYISMGDHEVMPLNGTLSMTFSKPMETDIKSAITVEPDAYFEIDWIDNYNMNISFYDLAPETEYMITFNNSLIKDINSIPMEDSYTYTFTSQGLPEIEFLSTVEDISKGSKIAVEAEIQSSVGLHEVLLFYNDTKGISHKIYAIQDQGDIWTGIIPQQNFSGELSYRFTAEDISGLVTESIEFIINVTNPSYVYPPNNVEAEADTPFEFSLRVTNPVGVLRVIIHYTTSHGSENSVNLQLESGNLTDGNWNCRLIIPEGDVSYQIEIVDVYGENITLPENHASFSVNEKSTLFGGYFLLIISIIVVVCIAAGGAYVLWKKRSDEDEEDQAVPAVVDGKSSRTPESTEDIDKNRCTVCFGQIDDPESRYRCSDCGNTYHKSCIDKVKECPVCGKDPNTSEKEE
ncbi:MAG: Ig-like domain-containing protein, partial [Thermoplasmata archaeon]